MRLILSGIVAFMSVLPTAFAAEQEYRGINISPIQSLYSQQLKNPESESIANQIADKSSLIRGILEENITNNLETPAEEEAPL